MKKGSILIAVLALVLTFENCAKKETLPTASFTFSPSDVFQYEEVQFTSTSSDADTYLWDFGGGQTTTEANPLVTFNTAGDWTVKLTATNGDGSNTTQKTISVNAPNNYYMLGDVEFAITTDFFWFQSSAGGDPYLRLLTDVDGQDNPDLIKLYPNQGLGVLNQVYFWEAKDLFGTPTTPGSYDSGYTANYAGLDYDWTAVGKTGSSDLVIEMVATDVYSISGDMILSVGYYDWAAGGIFVETGTETLVLSYIGPITPL